MQLLNPNLPCSPFSSTPPLPTPPPPPTPPTTTTTTTTTTTRRVLANVARARAFHADQIAWVLEVYGDQEKAENDDDDIAHDDNDQRVAKGKGAWVITELAKMDVLAETLQAELDEYDRSQRVWWATPGGVALLLAPIALGLRGGVVGGAGRLWRR